MGIHSMMIVPEFVIIRMGLNSSTDHRMLVNHY